MDFTDLLALLFAFIVVLIPILFYFFSLKMSARLKFINRQLIKSEEQYRTIFEGTNEGIVILDPVKMTLIHANLSFLRMFGLQVSDLPRITIPDLHPAESWDQILPEFKSLTEGRQKIATYISCLKKDGTIFYSEITARNVVMDDQKLSIGFFRDVTGRVTSESEKEKLQAQIFHSSKLASIGTLAAGVAHEINNPLMIVKGNLSLMKERVTQGRTEDLARFLDKQDKALDRVSYIVKTLGVFARTDDEGSEDVDLHQAIQDTISFCEQIYTKAQITIDSNLRSTHPYFSGNSSKIQQVILNLLSNARDACALRMDGGNIRIETHDENGFVILHVSDNGCGIAKHHQKLIFDPFFTTKPPGQGTGIGLSIAHSIVESFRGQISVESELGVGSTFTVRLPVSESTVRLASSALDKPEQRFSGSAMVVDDEADIRELLSEFLTDLGLAVTTARDGDEALDQLSKQAFDYVITDIKMPRMSGDQLLKKIRDFPHLAKTRFIVITGGIHTEYSLQQLEDIQRYSQGLIRKPFDRKTVAAMIGGTQKPSIPPS